jgi:hypothetical protein
MSTPDQSRHDEPRHDERGRSGGGVRGAINDLLGRNDRPEDGHGDDGARAGDERLTQERSAGQQPATTRYDGDPQHGESPRGHDGADGPLAGSAGAAAPGHQDVDDRVDRPAVGATPG